MFWDITFTKYTLKFFWTKFPSDQRHNFRIEVRELGTPLSIQDKEATHPVVVEI